MLQRCSRLDGTIERNETEIREEKTLQRQLTLFNVCVVDRVSGHFSCAQWGQTRQLSALGVQVVGGHQEQRSKFVVVVVVAARSKNQWRRQWKRGFLIYSTRVQKKLFLVFFHVVYVKQRSNNTNVQNKSVISWVRFAGHHPGRSVAGPVSNQAAGNEYFHGQMRIASHQVGTTE